MGKPKGNQGSFLMGFHVQLDTHVFQEILEGVTDVDLVINLKLREDVLVEKCLGRRMCSHCGGNFNIASINVNSEKGRPGMFMAPLLPPEHWMSKLVTRVDDTEEVVKERLRIYNGLSQPVEDYYHSTVIYQGE